MRITSVNPLSGFRLELRFDDGVSGVVDLSEFAGRGVFQAWLRPGLFEHVKITDSGAVEWPGEIDLCPDALYLRLTNKKPEDIFPSLANRLSNA
jgi:hypothetical protein